MVLNPVVHKVHGSYIRYIIFNHLNKVNGIFNITYVNILKVIIKNLKKLNEGINVTYAKLCAVST